MFLELVLWPTNGLDAATSVFPPQFSIVNEHSYSSWSAA